MERQLSDLRENGYNEKIYGVEELSDVFIESIRINGILEPLAIKADGTIMSGHRRWRAAKHLNMETVPVRVVGYDNELDEREAVIIFNKQRVKTFSQKAREAEELEAIEGERARQRMLAGKAMEPSGNISVGYKGETRDKVAERVGLGSGRTYDKAKLVWGKAKEGNEKAIEYVDKLDTGKITVSKAYAELRREQRKEERQEVEPPKGKYRVIYADPPWNYGDKRDGRTTGAEDHYPSMTIEELCEMPVKDITEDDAVLFLWVTSPLLEECFPIIRAWGFKYKTSFVWDKIKHNMGHYNSVRHELLLVCTKGSCKPDNVKLYDSVQSIEKTDHSRKPEEFRAIIDDIYTYGNKIELFARKPVDGWEAWGNEPNISN